jgi:probable HAF family extracellular repeat protein
MKKNVAVCLAVVTLGAMLLLSSVASGQQQQDSTHVRYRLVDLGTLGGPNSYQPFGYAADFFTERSLSAGGTFAGWADTAAADPYAPNCFFDCFVDHAFTWKGGLRADLGTLPGAPGLSSIATWISPGGLISGVSQNGEIDPLGGFPVFHGVLWRNGKIIDLQTLEGGYESQANAVNDQGQAVGFASNTMDDANSLQALVTQTRAILWQNGAMRDIGTLGGTDAEALFINERGQIVGQSYTAESIPPSNVHCAGTPLTLHAFFWEYGNMVDLGTLGGSCSFAYGLNGNGQVVGQATLAGDEQDHPYIWEHGKMKDLGALGGTYGYASWLNDLGEVVGAATNEGDQALLAFRWKDGAMTKLGVLPGNACSVSDAINGSGQVVGGSGVNEAAFFPVCTDSVEHAFLWEDDRMIDLNSFVPKSSELTLNEAVFINHNGEISGFGTLPNGDQHVFLLVPCEEGEDACEEAHEVLKTEPESSGIAPTRNSSQGQKLRPHPRACTRACGQGFRLSVALAGNSSGTVTSIPGGIDCGTICSANFQGGTVVGLIATPMAGSVLVAWSGACSGPGLCSIRMTQNDSVTATFGTAPPGFSLTPATSSLTLQSKGQVMDVITVAPQNGAFANAIQLTCSISGPAPVPTCFFSSSSVTPGAKSVSSTLTITAAGASTLKPFSISAHKVSQTLILMSLLGITIILTWRRERRPSFIFSGLLFTALLQSACGGSSGVTTERRNYTAAVMGVSGSLQESAQISLTAQ